MRISVVIPAWNEEGSVGQVVEDFLPLVDEVVVADSTSVNLYKLTLAALDLRPDRAVILSPAGQFPTDLYVAQGLAQRRQRGLVALVGGMPGLKGGPALVRPGGR